MTKIELKKAIGEGHIKRVIDELIKKVGENNLNDVILINSRYSELEIQNSRGVISLNEYMIERNKISKALLNLIDSINILHDKKISSEHITQDWKLSWIKRNYPDSIIKEKNQLPEIKEFANSKLDYRVILPEKFEIQDRLPYSGEVGINFINFHDEEKLKMSIDLGINLTFGGDMKKFILAIIVPQSDDNFAHEKYGQIKSLLSNSYNWEKVKSRIEIKMIENEK